MFFVEDDFKGTPPFFSLGVQQQHGGVAFFQMNPSLLYQGGASAFMAHWNKAMARIEVKQPHNA